VSRSPEEEARRQEKRRETLEAQRSAEARWGEQYGEAVRMDPGSVVVGLGDGGETEPEILGEGATWVEAFAAAELRCAPGLAQQLAESQAREKLMRAALESYPAGGPDVIAEDGAFAPLRRLLLCFEEKRRDALLSPAARRYVDGVRAALAVRDQNKGADSPEEDKLLDACDPLFYALSPEDNDAVSAVLGDDVRRMP
jgi:hypothetical protein